MSKTALAISLMVVALFLGAYTGFAQNFQGLNTLQNIASEGQTAGKYVVNIAFVFSGIIVAIELIPAGIKALKGDGAAKDAISNVGLGAIAIFLILAVIKVVMAFV